MNKWIGIGRLTKDPDLKYTNSSKAVATFTIACDKYPEGAEFINCVVWDKQAENLKKYCGKGSQIAVEGRVSVRNYDNKEGKKVYVTEIVTNNIMFLDSKKDGQVPVEAVVEETKVESDPFKDFQNELVLTDEDLPF